jgi:hypothetical protein
MHTGAVDGTAEQLFEFDQAMTLVEVQTALIIYWIAI